MRNDLEPLVLDLIDWVSREPRTYRETIDAWRTSCPRLTVWEDAVENGLVRRALAEGDPAMVVPTREGMRLLRARRPDSRSGLP
jgi:hypothetical protein